MTPPNDKLLSREQKFKELIENTLGSLVEAQVQAINQGSIFAANSLYHEWELLLSGYKQVLAHLDSQSATGIAPKPSEVCPKCKGSTLPGKVWVGAGIWKICDQCHGTGHTNPVSGSEA